MKRAINLLFCAAVLLIAVQAFSQERKFEWMIGGGIETPLTPQDFKDGWNLGWTGKLAAGYFLSPQFTLGANFSYNYFGLDESFFLGEAPGSTGVKISGGNLSIYELAGVGKYYFAQPQGKTNFYIMGGPGVALASPSDLKITSPDGSITEKFDNQTDFLLTGGAGITQQLGSGMRLFIEGRYSHVFASDQDTAYLPVRIGLIF